MNQRWACTQVFSLIRKGLFGVTFRKSLCIRFSWKCEQSLPTPVPANFFRELPASPQRRVGHTVVTGVSDTIHFYKPIFAALYADSVGISNSHNHEDHNNIVLINCNQHSPTPPDNTKQYGSRLTSWKLAQLWWSDTPFSQPRAHLKRNSARRCIADWWKSRVKMTPAIETGIFEEKKGKTCWLPWMKCRFQSQPK